MRKGGFAEEQIVDVRKGTLSVADVCREYGINDATFYKWRSRCSGMEIPELSRRGRLTPRSVRWSSCWQCRCFPDVASSRTLRYLINGFVVALPHGTPHGDRLAASAILPPTTVSPVDTYSAKVVAVPVPIAVRYPTAVAQQLSPKFSPLSMHTTTVRNSGLSGLTTGHAGLLEDLLRQIDEASVKGILLRNRCGQFIQRVTGMLLCVDRVLGVGHRHGPDHCKADAARATLQPLFGWTGSTIEIARAHADRSAVPLRHCDERRRGTQDAGCDAIDFIQSRPAQPSSVTAQSTASSRHVSAKSRWSAFEIPPDLSEVCRALKLSSSRLSHDCGPRRRAKLRSVDQLARRYLAPSARLTAFRSKRPGLHKPQMCSKHLLATLTPVCVQTIRQTIAL
jgi:hypothetical protein